MIAPAGAPYGRTETGAAYTEAAALLSDEFDTTGTPDGFCPLCEHAPCVSGEYPNWCRLTPRYLTVRRIQREVGRLVDQHLADWRNPVNKALTTSVSTLFTVASYRHDFSSVAYDSLVQILTELRAQPPKDES